jgi:hypothetical protein
VNSTSTTGIRKRLNINRDVFVFAFFVGLSFIFWYLNSLDKEVEATIRLPVKYTNMPRGRSVTEENPERLNLYVKGAGSAVMRRKLSGRKNPVVVDISKVNYKRVPGSKEPDYFIITSSLARSFRVQLRSEFEITSVKPDTLFFRLERIADQQSSADQRKSQNKNAKQPG